ncbi:MAG: hypothetical protein JSV23_01810 [Promethearchaeota archaeon]|nr:MAG: hypothetical protein JSV23_01810 [Candidatus Lokiarchaeota archaeon]
MNFISHFGYNDLFGELFPGVLLTDLQKLYFGFFQVLFKFMKYTFVFIILFIGILTLLRLRGIYLQQRSKNIKNEEDQLGKVRIILGTSYICLGFGILFNYLIYFLIWIFNPLPEGLIFMLIGIFKPFFLEDELLIDSLLIYLHPIIALLSFLAIIYFFMSLYYLINNNRVISNPYGIVWLLLKSIGMIILFGFSTSLPYLV